MTLKGNTAPLLVRGAVEGDNAMQKVETINDLRGSSLKQLIWPAKKAIKVIAQGNENPVRLYAANAYTSLKLLLIALDEEAQEPLKEVITPVKKRLRSKRVDINRPADIELLLHKRHKIPYKDLARVYGVSTDTVKSWYSNINRKNKVI